MTAKGVYKCVRRRKIGSYDIAHVMVGVVGDVHNIVVVSKLINDDNMGVEIERVDAKDFSVAGSIMAKLYEKYARRAMKEALGLSTPQPLAQTS